VFFSVTKVCANTPAEVRDDTYNKVRARKRVETFLRKEQLFHQREMIFSRREMIFSRREMIFPRREMIFPRNRAQKLC
jgi:hypothetical protein